MEKDNHIAVYQPMIAEFLGFKNEDGLFADKTLTLIIHHNQNPKYLAYYFHSSMFFAQKKKLAHRKWIYRIMSFLD